MDEFLDSAIRKGLRLAVVCLAGVVLLALAITLLIHVVQQLSFVLITPGGLVLVVLAWRYFGRRNKTLD